MGRTDGLSIYIDETNKTKLMEIYGGVIENIQKKLLSTALKSQNFTGDMKAGSVEFKRFTNASSKTYGSARTAGAGDKLKAPPITVNLDVHKEIVEEATISDIERLGVASIVDRRKKNHMSSMQRELERAFFQEGYVAGSEYSPVATTEIDILSELIVSLETIKNDYVDGVERDMISVVCSPAFFEKIRKSLDASPNSNVNTAGEIFGSYHGVKVFSSNYLPANVNIMGMAAEAIAQPVVMYPYDAEKIPLSNDAAIELFYDYGTEALTPELIKYVLADDATINALTVTSAEGAAIGKTVVTVVGFSGLLNRSLVYKTHATTAPTATFDLVLTGWTALPADGILTATNGHKITVAEITEDNKAKGAGNATLVVKTS